MSVTTAAAIANSGVHAGVVMLAIRNRQVRSGSTGGGVARRAQLAVRLRPLDVLLHPDVLLDPHPDARTF